MIPISIGAVSEAVGGKWDEAGASSVCCRVTTDSRDVKPGDLFIPIRGERFDGHSFLAQAITAGAACCLSEQEVSDCGSCSVIYVKDTKKALGSLAKYYRSLFSIPVIGITGSVGKTTTKDMIASVLSQKYQVLKTAGNFNNEIGLPLTIFQLEEAHEAAVLEMGMNHFGEIHYLADLARPDLAVITNIGVSHVENLGSREGILRAKSEIFDFMTEDQLAVLNADDEYLFTLMGKTACKIQWVGINSRLGMFADDIVSCGLSGSRCSIHLPNEKISVTIPSPGAHMVQNALAAAAIGYRLGLTGKQIAAGIAEFVPTKMRMAVKKTPSGQTLIDDSYNANPISMKAAIDVLAGESGTKAAVLGDMLELGSFSTQMHYDVGQYCAKKDLDVLVCIGEAAKELARGAEEAGLTCVRYYERQELFWEAWDTVLDQTDVILVKASHGMHLEKTAEKICGVKV